MRVKAGDWVLKALDSKMPLIKAAFLIGGSPSHIPAHTSPAAAAPFQV